MPLSKPAMPPSAHQRAKAARKQVADIIEQALKITYRVPDGPTRVTRDGDTLIRVRHPDPDGGGPVYTRVQIVAEA